MTEEVPKTSPFLKFIVIFMGILIVLGLVVVVWKVIDLAKQKAAREEMEAAQKEQTFLPKQQLVAGFDFEVALESDEVILQTSATTGGILFRIGRDGKTDRLIYKDFTGKTLGRIKIKRTHEDPMPAN